LHGIADATYPFARATVCPAKAARVTIPQFVRCTQSPHVKGQTLLSLALPSWAARPISDSTSWHSKHFPTSKFAEYEIKRQTGDFWCFSVTAIGAAECQKLDFPGFNGQFGDS